MNHKKVIGLDIGGTKVHIGTVQDGNILAQLKLPTSAQASKKQIIAEIIAGIGQLMEPGIAGIGIGVPGLGGGILIANQLHSGRLSSAGELGCIPICKRL